MLMGGRLTTPSERHRTQEDIELNKLPKDLSLP